MEGFTHKHVVISFWWGIIMAATVGPAVLLGLIPPVWLVATPFLSAFIFCGATLLPQLVKARREQREEQKREAEVLRRRPFALH